MSHYVAFRAGTLQSLQTTAARCCSKQQRTISPFRIAVRRQCIHRPSTLIRAESGEEKGKQISDRKVSEQTNKLVDGMKKGGIDQSTAQRILDTWEKTGATSTDALRKMLLGRSLKTVGVVLFQLLLDGGAAYGSYNSARRVCNSIRDKLIWLECCLEGLYACFQICLHHYSAVFFCRYVGQEHFFGKVVVEYGAYFLASYFALGVVFDTFTLGVLAASAFQYSTNTEAFMAAIKEVAGASKRGPSINVVEKAQTAVNAVKVASALNQISGPLKVSCHAD